MSVRALGRVVQIGTSATTAAVRFNMTRADGIMFVLIGATSGAATIQEHNAASSGTSQNLAVITKYHRQDSGVWAAVTQAAGATFTAATGGLAVAEIEASSLSDGFKWISASHASGSFVAILRDLKVQRNPVNYTSLVA